MDGNETRYIIGRWNTGRQCTGLECLTFQLTTRNRTSEMERYHIMTAWGAELCRPGFDTLSEAVEMAGEICADTFMLDGEEM